jgi:hypothetical protein
MVCREGREDVHRVFELVMANQAAFPVRTMCRLLEVSSSGYQDWCECPASRRQLDDAVLTEALPRHQSEPGGELPSTLEVARIAGRGHERTGSNGADTGDRLQPAAGFAVAMPELDVSLQLLHLPVKLPQVLHEPLDQIAKAPGQRRLGLLDEPWHPLVEAADALWDDQAELG